ncbi:MAG: galactose-1-phosphate uridylyltransferase, partial [Clostridia bacterium]|nr:galactose-1-phosphate uridylyltransferase [Clostridia bacterium]
PQYCIGSNAPLPIVGGSILAHEHFQGGKHVFPMFKAPIGKRYKSTVKGVKVFMPDWYNSVILIKGKKKSAVLKAGKKVLDKWLTYSDEGVGIIAATGDVPHNTLSPIARKTKKGYELYLLLRNNRCNDEHPDGIFHAHKEYHNIKSESIGLIEAMGRFILPGRLDYQLREIEKVLTGETKKLAEDMKIHEAAVEMLVKAHGTSCTKQKAHKVVIAYVEDVCENILKNTAVFKRDEKGLERFDRFMSACGFTK